MIGLNDITDLFANNFMDGNTTLAGMVIYAGVLILILVLMKNSTHALIITLPITLVFSTLGILSTDLMILMIIITVLGLAFTTRRIWS